MSIENNRIISYKSKISALKTKEEINEEAQNLLDEYEELLYDLPIDVMELTDEGINELYDDRIALYEEEMQDILSDDATYFLSPELIEYEVEKEVKKMEKERDEFVRSYKKDMLTAKEVTKKIDFNMEKVVAISSFVDTEDLELYEDIHSLCDQKKEHDRMKIEKVGRDEDVLENENTRLSVEGLLDDYHLGDLELDSEYGISSSKKFDGEAIKYFVEHYIETNAGEKVLIKFPEHVKVRELRDDICELEDEIYNVMNDPPEALEPNDAVVDLENELKNKNESLYYMTSNELNDRFNYDDPIELQDEKGNVYDVREIEGELEGVKEALVNYYLRDEYGEDYSPSDIQELSEFVDEMDFTKPVYIAYTKKGDSDELEHNTLLDVNNLTLSTKITGENVEYTEVIDSYKSLKHLAQDIDGWDFDYLIAEDNLDYEEIIKEDEMLSQRDKEVSLEP